jgi:hypothetical protein
MFLRFSVAAAACLLVAAATFAAGTLDLYFIDVEGGQATLVATPSGHSMLVDTGWGGFNGRDADRIDEGFGIKVSAAADGSFTVTNERNGFSKKYGAPPAR